MNRYAPNSATDANTGASAPCYGNQCPNEQQDGGLGPSLALPDFNLEGC